LTEFNRYLLEVVTAGKLKISVPGCAFPERQFFVVEKKKLNVCHEIEFNLIQ